MNTGLIRHHVVGHGTPLNYITRFRNHVGYIYLIWKAWLKFSTIFEKYNNCKRVKTQLLFQLANAFLTNFSTEGWVMQNGFYIFLIEHTHARTHTINENLDSSLNGHPLHLIFSCWLGHCNNRSLVKSLFLHLSDFHHPVLAQHWAYQYIISLQLFLHRITDFSDYNLNSSDAPGAARTLHHNSHISLSGYDISNIPASCLWFSDHEVTNLLKTGWGEMGGGQAFCLNRQLW